MQVAIHVTDAMIAAAMKKAIEAGWVPRNSMQINHDSMEIMRSILQAAVDAMPKKRERN